MEKLSLINLKEKFENKCIYKHNKKKDLNIDKKIIKKFISSKNKRK